MPFDSSLPADHSPIVAAELRNQLNALKDLIDGLLTSPAMQDLLDAQAAGACKNVPELNLTVSDPPTQAEVQAIADKMDFLLFNLKRE
ncbi:MAG: hypothetical protein WCS94_03565 [Verrucomicrobiota bacterium]